MQAAPRPTIGSLVSRRSSLRGTLGMISIDMMRGGFECVPGGHETILPERSTPDSRPPAFQA